MTTEAIRRTLQRPGYDVHAGWQSPARTMNAPRVLIVDDDTCARATMASTLHRCGCEVIEAASTDEGMALARTQRPDVIVLDVVCDGLEGWNALRMLKSDPTTAQMPVIVTTIQDDRDNALMAGAASCIFKPSSRNEIIGALRDAAVFARGSVVLAVDQSPASLAMYERLLAPWGYCVARAADQRGAAHALEIVRPDVAIVDIGAGEATAVAQVEALRRGCSSRGPIGVVAIASGYAAARAFEARMPGVEVVAQSGVADAFAIDLAEALHRASRRSRGV